MKRLLALGVIDALTLSGCASGDLAVEKGLVAGYSALDLAARAALTAHTDGVCVGQCWVTVKADLDKVKIALDTGDLVTATALLATVQPMVKH